MTGALAGLKRGDLIEVTDSAGIVRTKRAFGPVTTDGFFPVVWACREEEWRAAEVEGREPAGIPWPAEDVQLPGKAGEPT